MRFVEPAPEVQAGNRTPPVHLNVHLQERCASDQTTGGPSVFLTAKHTKLREETAIQSSRFFVWFAVYPSSDPLETSKNQMLSLAVVVECVVDSERDAPHTAPIRRELG